MLFLKKCLQFMKKKTLLKMYEYATGKPFGFLYVNLMAKSKTDMFFSNFTEKLIPKNIK